MGPTNVELADKESPFKRITALEQSNGPNFVLMVYSRNRKQKGEIGPSKSSGGIGGENNIVTKKENWANSEGPVASKENGSPILMKGGSGLKEVALWDRNNRKKDVGHTMQ